MEMEIKLLYNTREMLDATQKQTHPDQTRPTAMRRIQPSYSLVVL